MLTDALHSAQQALAAAYSKRGARVTLRQIQLLSAIKDLPNPTQSDVVNHTGVDRSTAADVFQRLISRGFITSRRCRKDARVNRLKITDSGIEALNEGIAAMAHVEIKALALAYQGAPLSDQLYSIARMNDQEAA